MKEFHSLTSPIYYRSQKGKILSLFLWYHPYYYRSYLFYSILMRLANTEMERFHGCICNLIR